MIGLSDEKRAYFLADSTLPFYVEFEFDAAPFACLLARKGLQETAFKREMLYLKMFAVYRSLEQRFDEKRRGGMWQLYLKEMERVFDLVFPVQKGEIKSAIAPALDTYSHACAGNRQSIGTIVGIQFARRLGADGEHRLAEFGANTFWRKSERAEFILTRRFWL